MGTEREMRTKEEMPNDVILVPKSLVINVAVALVFFILGGTAGFFIAGLVPLKQDALPTQAAIQQYQPTAPPARVENVSADDDPSIGPADAPVTIVEFSDYR